MTASFDSLGGGASPFSVGLGDSPDRAQASHEDALRRFQELQARSAAVAAGR
jgi:hypothetical protein